MSWEEIHVIIELIMNCFSHSVQLNEMWSFLVWILASFLLFFHFLNIFHWCCSQFGWHFCWFWRSKLLDFIWLFIFSFFLNNTFLFIFSRWKTFLTKLKNVFCMSLWRHKEIGPVVVLLPYGCICRNRKIKKTTIPVIVIGLLNPSIYHVINYRSSSFVIFGKKCLFFDFIFWHKRLSCYR